MVRGFLNLVSTNIWRRGRPSRGEGEERGGLGVAVARIANVLGPAGRVSVSTKAQMAKPARYLCSSASPCPRGGEPLLHLSVVSSQSLAPEMDERRLLPSRRRACGGKTILKNEDDDLGLGRRKRGVLLARAPSGNLSSQALPLSLTTSDSSLTPRQRI